MSKKAMKLALGKIKSARDCHPNAVDTLLFEAEEILETELEEQPAQQEPVARQYQNRDGVWKDFISEKHYKDTLEDGSWPIRNLYTSPPAQKECEKCSHKKD